jgi:hypothetical protein
MKSRDLIKNNKKPVQPPPKRQLPGKRGDQDLEFNLYTPTTLLESNTIIFKAFGYVVTIEWDSYYKEERLKYPLIEETLPSKRVLSGT